MCCFELVFTSELLGQAISVLLEPPSPSTMTTIVVLLPFTEPPLVCDGCGGSSGCGGGVGSGCSKGGRGAYPLFGLSILK